MSKKTALKPLWVIFFWNSCLDFLSAFDSMQDSEDTLMREEEVVKADLKAADELMMPFQQQLSTNKLLM